MNRTIKKFAVAGSILILSVLVVVMGVKVYAAQSLSTMVVTLENKLDITKTLVKIDQMPVALSSSDPYTYTKKVKSGSHIVEVSSDGLASYSLTVDVNRKETRVLNVTLGDKEVLSAQDQAAELYGLETSYISGARYFDNDKWLTFFTRGPGENEEGTFVVARYSGVEWVFVDEGSDIGPQDIPNAPKDLVEYLESRL